MVVNPCGVIDSIALQFAAWMRASHCGSSVGPCVVAGAQCSWWPSGKICRDRDLTAARFRVEVMIGLIKSLGGHVVVSSPLVPSCVYGAATWWPDEGH